MDKEIPKPKRKRQSLASNINVSGSRSDITIGEWNHVALSWEQNGTDLTNTFHFNGAVAATNIVVADFTSIFEIRVGSFNIADNANNFDNQFDGRLYDMQVYDGVLSTSQLASLASSPGSVIPEPSAAALLIGALSGFIVLRRRRS